MAQTDLDSFDRAILRELQADGRLSNRELASRIGLSPAPCWRRVRALEEAGVLTGYRAVVDRQTLGLQVLALASVSLDNHHPDTVAAFDAAVAGVPEILECHMVSGDADYALSIVAEDMAAYAALVRRHLLVLPGVNRISSNFVMMSTKTAAPLPVPDARQPR